MKNILPIIAMLCTAGATLFMLVLNVAGAANASAGQLRSMKLWAGGLTLLAVACVIVSIILLRNGQPGRAALIAFLPTVVMGILFFIAIL